MYSMDVKDLETATLQPTDPLMPHPEEERTQAAEDPAAEPEAPKEAIIAETGDDAQNEKAAGPTEPAAPDEPVADEKAHLLELQGIAGKLFREEFVSIRPEEYTQFLAAQEADLALIREMYMDHFRWDPSLLKLTRMLCAKLYLKGESQEIDRILSAFTRLYIKQHPVNVFCTRNFEKIYIVLYLLILLNTALHNNEVDRRLRISQSEYIRNTLQTFLQQNRRLAQLLTIKQKIQIERELHAYYDDLARHELHLKQDPLPQRRNNRLSVAETVRSTIDEPNLSRQLSELLFEDSRLRRLNTANLGVSQALTLGRVGFGRVLSDAPTLGRRQSKVSMAQSEERIALEDFDVADFVDATDAELELQGAPYLKEGLLKLTVFHNDSSELQQEVASSASLAVSVGSRGFFGFWRRRETPPPLAKAEYFVVVSKGELHLYLFDAKMMRKQQQRMKKYRQQQPPFGLDDEPDGDGNWLKNAVHIGDYNLCGTVAVVEDLRVTVTFPKLTRRPPKRFVFEAGTPEIAQEYANTCNFWAARITAVPALEESVLSLEYGWNDLERILAMGESFKRHKGFSRWEDLPKGVYLAKHGEDGCRQFIATLRYYNNLKGLYNGFSQRRTLFMRGCRAYSGTSNYKFVFANYTNRANAYKVELTKYKHYLVMLAYGLHLRFKMEETELPLRLQVAAEIEQLVNAAAGVLHDSHDVQRESLPDSPAMVKLPKTFSLSEMSSPVAQLLDQDEELVLAKRELVMSFSTNTIREEEEPED